MGRLRSRSSAPTAAISNIAAICCADCGTKRRLKPQQQVKLGIMRLQANGLLHKLTNLVIAAVMLVLSSRPSLAWGVAGHHIVAAIAWSRLSPAAQASIR